MIERSPRTSVSRVALWTLVLASAGLPLGWIVVTLVSNSTAWNNLFPDSFRLQLLGRTLLFAVAAAVVAAALSIPVAVVIGRGRGIIAGVCRVVVPIGLLLPTIALAYGWKQIARLADVSLAYGSWQDITRCVWTIAAWLWPIPAMVVGLALRRSDTSVQEQALLDGRLLSILARQLSPAMIASVLVVAVLALQEFAVYEPSGISVIATEVRMVFETGGFSSVENPITQQFGFSGSSEGVALPDQSARAAAALATGVPMLTVVMVCALIAGIVARRAAVDEQLDLGRWPTSLNAGWFSKLAAAGVLLVGLVAPIVALVFSMKRTLDVTMLWEEFGPQVSGSIMLALLAGSVALMLGCLAVLTLSRGAALVAGAAFLVGGQLLAIAMIRIFNRDMTSWLYDGAGMITLAYIARFGWIALVAGNSTWGRNWAVVRELAELDGARGWSLLRHVMLPLAGPLLIAAAVLVGVLCIGEVPATVLISPLRPQPLVPMLMTWVHMLRYDAMIEASLLLMGVTGALGLLVMALIWFARQSLRAMESAKR